MGEDEAQAAARIQLVYRGRLARFSADRRRRSLVRREATARWEREQAVIKIQVSCSSCCKTIKSSIQSCELGTPETNNSYCCACVRVFVGKISNPQQSICCFRRFIVVEFIVVEKESI